MDALLTHLLIFVVSLFLLSFVSTSSIELCQRRHLFTASNDTNGTVITYTNSHTSDLSTTFIDGHFLPNSSVCGRDHERCNLLITLNHTASILVVLFPLATGVGLVSYDVSENDTLDFREVYVVTENPRRCAFVYFLETIARYRGYCLDTAASVPFLYSQRIVITHNNLSLSHVDEPDGMVRTRIYEFRSLSNFVYIQDADGCLSSQGDHVVFMESGFLVDHRFSNHDFVEHIEVDSSCVESSRLTRIPQTCILAVQCGGKLTFVDIAVRPSGQQLSPITEVEFGQVFVCPNREFLGFRNDTLSVYTTDRSLSRNVSFPIGQDIRRGDCAIVNDELVFVASLSDGRSFLFEFGSSDAVPYRQLGESDQSVTSATVVDGVVFVNNDNESLAYDIRSRCVQDPISTPHNFVLANVFTTSSTALCRCPAFPNPTSTSVTPSSTLEVEMESSSSVLLPVSSPMPTSSTVMNPLYHPVLIVCFILLPVLTLIAVVFTICLFVWIHIRRRKRKPVHRKIGDWWGASSLDDLDISGLEMSILTSEDQYSAEGVICEIDTSLQSKTQNASHNPMATALLAIDENKAVGDNNLYSDQDSSGEDYSKLQRQLLENRANNSFEPPTTPRHEQLELESVVHGNEMATFSTLVEETPCDVSTESAASATNCTRPLSEVDRGTSQLCTGQNFRPHYSTNDNHVPMASDDNVMVQPVTADQQNSNGFMIGPSSSASLAPLPDNVLQNCRQHTDRENQQTLRDIADNLSGTSTHSDPPNNDLVNRQHSTTSEDNEGYQSDASNLLYHPLNSSCQDTQSRSPPHVHIPSITMSCESNINSVTMSDSECEGTFVHGESELNKMILLLHESENEQTLESPDAPPVQLNLSEQLHVQDDHAGTVCPLSSKFFTEAKITAKVPFLYHHVLECDSHGCELVIKDHDIIVRIPEGAIDIGKRVCLEIGVTMFGPFKFSSNSQPISPILWMCLLDDSIILKKPFQVILPHYLTNLTVEELQDHHVRFAKARHFNSNLDETQPLSYTFQPFWGNLSFYTSGEQKSYGILETFHCCFLCIEAKKTPQLVTDTSYCLVRIVVPSSQWNYSEIYFATTYFLDTCLKALEEQYPGCEFRYTEFKFESCDDPCLKIALPENECHYTIGKEPKSAEIRLVDINFWQTSFDRMLLKHKKRTYPPRVVITITMKVPEHISIPITFSGFERSDQLDVVLTFPLKSDVQSPISSPHSIIQSTSYSQFQCHVKKEINLSNAFRKTLRLAHKWKSIATLLNIQESVLQNIEKEEKAVEDCLREVLAHRIHRMDTPLTWSELADAVDPFDKALASELDNYHRIARA